MMVETTDETLMPSSLPCLPCCTKKFSANNIPLSSSVRLWESRDVRFVPTTCAQSLREREGTGLRTVIIMRIKKEMCENQLDRESSPSDKAAVMSRRSSLQRTGKAAAMDRGSSPAGKAAVVFIGDGGHLKCVNSHVNNNQSFCSTLNPVSPSGSRHLVVKTEFPGKDKASAKVDQIQHLYLGPEVVSRCGTQHQVICFDNAERQKHQEFSSKNINHANKSLSQGSSEAEESSNFKRNMFDYIRENKVFSTVFRYITTDWCASWQDTEHFVQHPTASLAVSLCSWLCMRNGKEEDNNEGNESHYCCSTVCAQPKQQEIFELQQLEQNSSEDRDEVKKVGIFPHKPTTDYIGSVKGDTVDLEESGSGGVSKATSDNGIVVVKDVASTDTECREYGEETLYRPLQLHTALSGNEFELGTIDNGAIVYPHSSHVSNNVASERQGLACATNKEFEREYFKSGREVPQRYQNAYDLCNNRMKLKQQEDHSPRLPNNNNFMQNVRASTPLAVDRKTVVEANTNEDKEDNEGTIIMRRQRLNNQCPTNKTWLNRPVNIVKHCNNYISPHRSCEKVSNVQRKQMLHTSTQQEDRNKIIIMEHYYVKNTVQKKPELKCIICYEETHENAIKFEERILHQKRIETFWPQWILRQTRIQITQSANGKTDQSVSREIDAYTAGLPHVRALKSAVRSTRSARVDGPSAESTCMQSSSTESARQPPETYKKGKRTLFNIHSTLNADESTSTQKISTSPNKTSSFQNYTILVKTCRVNMVRTKQTAKKERDDHRRDDRRRDVDRRQDDNRDEPERRPRGRPPQAPASTTYVCFFCKKVNKQRTNHRRHLILQHKCQIDGTPATEADIEQARAWSSHEPASQRQRANQQSYKSKEFDADSTPEQSAQSLSPSPSPSPSPPRQGHKRPRKESPPPKRQSPRRGKPSRGATPPPAPPAKACRRVRFEKSEPPAWRDERGASRKKFEPSSEPTASTSKEHQSRSTQQTADRRKADIDHKQLKIDRSKIDPLVCVAEQAIKNLEARKDKSTDKSSKSTNKKEEPVVEQPKKHQHPLPSKGKSAYAGKWKASAPSTSTAAVPTPEIVVSPPEPRQELSPRPVAKIQPKLSSEELQSKASK